MEDDLRYAIEARDRFLSIASHELNTPLTSMKLQAQFYLRQLQKQNHEFLKEKRITKFASDTLRQTSNLERLVNDMLDISRINTGKLTYQFKETELCSLLHEVIENIKPHIEASGSKLELELCKELYGTWDRQRLEQVLVNILTNAARYGEGKPIQIYMFKEQDWAKIKVIDHGIGIAPIDQKRIFEQFERAVNHNQVSGFGLGLYISKKILDAHGGNLTVESKLGSGSTFILSLPLSLKTGDGDNIAL